MSENESSLILETVPKGFGYCVGKSKILNYDSKVVKDMQFGGELDVAASPSLVFAVVTNPEKFGKAIPDLKKLTVTDSSKFYAEFTIKLGFMGGLFKMNFEYQDLSPPSKLKLVGRGSGVQSNVDLGIDLNVSSAGSGSKLTWTANLSVGGLVASVGGRLMENFAKQKIEQIVKGLKEVIDSESQKTK
jgi:carbon monoxide dehydrogenase subunit G